MTNHILKRIVRRPKFVDASLLSLGVLLCAALPAAAQSASGAAYPGISAQAAAATREADAAELAGAIVQAQPPAPGEKPQQTGPIVPRLHEPRPAPPAEARVGVNESDPLPLTVRQAVEMALVRNRELEVERINTEQAEYDLQAAKGFYDPVLHSLDYYNYNLSPVTSSLGGGDNGKLKTTTISSEVTLRKVFEYGGVFDAGLQNIRVDTDNLFASINPQYQSGLTFTFRQPILRGLSMDDNRRRLKVASLRLDQSDEAFRQRVIETIVAVQRAYWDLGFALKGIQVARDSVQLAETQIARLKRLVQEGISAPVDLVQVEAELEQRRGNVFAATEIVTATENNLKALILEDRSDPEWNRPIIPTEATLPSPGSYDVDAAVALAIQNRPELAQLKMQEQINNIDIKFFKDQAKPQLDLFGSYGLTGLAGAATSTVNPFGQQNFALQTRVNQLSLLAGLPPLPPSATQTVPEFLLGGYGQSYSNLFSNDFRAVRIGVEFSWPVGMRTAEAALGRVTAEGRKLEVQRQALEQRVEREVRNALQAVKTSRSRVDAAQAAREAAEVQLASEQRRYEAGLTTTFLVLTRQDDLSQARARELSALTDYNKAVVELQRVIGTTLSTNDVDVMKVRGTGDETDH
ncbi:MAG TPA: TolC family protein [Blastocatellia bacterium]|nr:TolC family protein [Blastocatellia bacterium]